MTLCVKNFTVENKKLFKEVFLRVNQGLTYLHLNHPGFLLEMYILCPNPGLRNPNWGKGSPIRTLHNTLL